ncbi:MAG: hypothetical protein F6K31_32865 [Symploca sp. SIO2G7]|nr:hypothetical protein [Symploca sp. SIO2G7]
MKEKLIIIRDLADIESLEINLNYADTQETQEWNDLVGIFSEDGRVRLDVGIRAMKEEVPASHESWATRG